ncbi:Kdo hydroxylase family protein [Rhodoferax sp. WC2427]|uniref:Kdo hydroxylase family protein n=1 Tax=Rhodoferax sp. WC2427 TaxID=3234144 RepID=UPI003465E3C4
MSHQIMEVPGSDWEGRQPVEALTDTLESGGVLYFPALAFSLSQHELPLLRPGLRAPKSRNISQPARGVVKGAQGTVEELQALSNMMQRYRHQAVQLVHGLFPRYSAHLRLEPTSYRPTEVATRTQSWRADDKRLHVDAFPSRPNRGERILRVFSNINPLQQPRVWRVGEPFESMARQFLPLIPGYRAWEAHLLRGLGVTKSLRSEYDHMMLQLHDHLKRDANYQKNAPQTVVEFAAGSTWVCFSDQTLHAVLGGQYMMEQTFFMPPQHQYRPDQSPLGILTRLAGHPLQGAPL